MSAASSAPAPLRFTAYVTSPTGPVVHDALRRALPRQADFDDLERWVRLARTLERGRFDAVLFSAAVWQRVPWSHEGGYFEANIQAPSSDPGVLAGAIAYVTDHLGIALTASILHEHPTSFARRVSTLDHASRGRIAWNMVADDLPATWVEEYADVTYKLWEGSWDDDALAVDGRAGRPAGDGKVHSINHQGLRYEVEGPHLVSPSPQRTPLLFQAAISEAASSEAAISEADRAFAARHAEAVFLSSPGPAEAALDTADIRSRAVRNGRLPEDIRFFQSLRVITGGTEAEARRKASELAEGTGDTARRSPYTAAGSPIVGTAEQIADELANWQGAGIDGVNLVNDGDPRLHEDFVDYVVPVLQNRGLMQREYTEGTLRHKLFGQEDRRGGRLPDRHPAARYRGAFVPQHA